MLLDIIDEIKSVFVLLLLGAPWVFLLIAVIIVQQISEKRNMGRLSNRQIGDPPLEQQIWEGTVPDPREGARFMNWMADNNPRDYIDMTTKNPRDRTEYGDYVTRNLRK